MIILIFLPGDDAKQATTYHFQNRMRWIGSSVDQLSGQTLSEAQLSIKLSKQQQAGIGAKMFLHRFNFNAPFEGNIDFQIP